MTREGGNNPVESPDGQHIYYTKEQNKVCGVWEVPSDGGEEVEIIPSIRTQFCFSVGALGVYFIKDETNTIQLWDPETRETRQLVDIEGSPPYSLEVPPDGRWALYAQSEQEADLMLVEGFR